MLKPIGALFSTFSLALVMTLAGPTASPALAATGGPIAYNEPNRYGGQDVWLINSDGSGNRRMPLAPELLASAEAPVWSRDGKHIAVTGLIGSTSLNPAKILVVSDALATDVRAFFPPTTLYDIYKTFSPNGQRVAYASFALNFVDFGVRSIDGRENTLLGSRNNTQGTSGLGIDWSPRDSNLLVASLAGLDVSFTPRALTRLYRVPAVANGLNSAVALTSPVPPSPFVDIYDMFPAFSPDGGRVAFVRYIIDGSSFFGPQVTKSQIRVISIDGSHEQQLMELREEFVSSLSWSADGTQLVLDRVQSPAGVPVPNGDLGLWLLNAAGLRMFLPPQAASASWSWAPTTGVVAGPKISRAIGATSAELTPWISAGQATRPAAHAAILDLLRGRQPAGVGVEPLSGTSAAKR